ncbi:MAG: HK97 family phage prohead protease [Nitratireductor sp.]
MNVDTARTRNTAGWARPGAGAGEGGRFRGYASLFGRLDQGRDLIEPGAFARALAKKGPGGIRMLFQHDPAQPIGRWLALREDARGLFVEGVLSSGVGRAREVRALIAEGAIDGLSIGFRTVRAARDPRRRVRRILEADLWEISVVTFPMLTGARVEAIDPDSGAGAAPQTPLTAQSADLAGIIRAATFLIEGKEPQ